MDQNFSENKKEVLLHAFIATISIVALGILVSYPITLATGLSIGLLSICAVSSSVFLATKLLQNPPSPKSFLFKPASKIKAWIKNHPYLFLSSVIFSAAILVTVTYQVFGKDSRPLLDNCFPEGKRVAGLKKAIFDLHRMINWFERRTCILFFDPPRPPFEEQIGPINNSSSLAQNQKFYDSITYSNAKTIVDHFQQQIGWHTQRTCIRILNPIGEDFNYIEKLKEIAKVTFCR